MKVIRGKRALVTGAASGIGRSIALALAREGADLFLLDVDGARLAAVAEEARRRGIEVIDQRCDVSRPAEVGASVEALIERWGTLDILINNAGIVYHGNTGDMDEAQWDELLATNLNAPLLFIRRLLPLLLARHEAHIVNVCSLYGLVPKRKVAAYQMTKFGLVGLSQSLRYEYSPAGLGVTALCPGVVDTNLLNSARERGWVGEKFRFPHALSISPDRVAESAIESIRKNKGLVVVSTHARLLWMLHRLSPAILDGWQHWKRRRRQRA
jgi:3-oxoacyl-[acyl-carrier protein] reductase